MNKSFEKVISTLEYISLSGNSYIKDFGVGWIGETLTRELKYPCLWIDNEMNSHSYQNGSFTFTFDMYIFDLVYDDESNEISVLSDTTSSGIDFINNLIDNYDSYGFWLDKSGKISFEHFTEKFDDKVSGIKINCSFIIPDDGSSCENIFNQ